jgi:fatty-acid desaturase
MPPIDKDRFHIWLNRLYWLPLVLLGLALLALGGWSYLMWGIFFRVTFNLHATWWLTQRRTCGARAGSQRLMIQGTTGGSRC